MIGHSGLLTQRFDEVFACLLEVTVSGICFPQPRLKVIIIIPYDAGQVSCIWHHLNDTHLEGEREFDVHEKGAGPPMPRRLLTPNYYDVAKDYLRSRNIAVEALDSLGVQNHIPI